MYTFIEFKKLKTIKFFINKSENFENYQNLVLEITKHLNEEKQVNTYFYRNCLTLDFLENTKQSEINLIKSQIQRIFKKQGFIKIKN